MGRLRAAAFLLAALAACLLLAACGSSGNGELLPGTTADQITSNLDLVRESNSEGNCEEAEVAVAEVNEEIDALQGVDKKLKSALEEGASKLSEVVGSCSAGAEAEEQKEAEEAQAEAQEREQVESEEDQEAAEEEHKTLEKQQKTEEREERETPQEKAEEEAEQPGPSEEGEESGPKGKAKGHEKQEEAEPPSEEEVTPPPVEEGPAGGIGPGAEAGGGG
jgi:hypothetical protein